VIDLFNSKVNKIKEYQIGENKVTLLEKTGLILSQLKLMNEI
jgi:hypothetical protein